MSKTPMLKRIFSITTFAALLFAFALIYQGHTVLAASAIGACDGSNSAICKTDQKLIDGILKEIINLMLYFAGIIAVIMVIVGGIRYIMSDGDSSKATQAKNTIIYALVGVAVSVMSYSIVNFVIGRL